MDELVEKWVAGWAASRSMPVAPVAGVDGAWRVDVASESRELEYVAVRPGVPAARTLTALVAGHSDRWLTIGGPRNDGVEAIFSGLDLVTHVETMMVAPIVPGSQPSTVVLEQDGAVAHARIEMDGDLAASGQVAVVGRDAIIDKIVTTEEFRRRGFGRDIMAALTDWAAQRGAKRGILLASHDGAHLYRSLGWSEALPAVTYRGAPLRSD